jgi:hypothetical protein
MSATEKLDPATGWTRIPNIMGDGPITKFRLRRARALHYVLCLIGAMPWAFDMPPALQAAGWGLWFPGIGFVAAGGWATLLYPVALVFFAIGFFAWFGSGMIIGPIIVWGLAALFAGMVEGGASASYAYWFIPSFTIVWLVVSAIMRKKRLKAQIKTRAMRNDYLAKELKEIDKVADQAPPIEERELNQEQLGMINYLLELSLQPIGQLKGFNKIDQFQTSSLRYQLNMVGYALSAAQRHYAPNFHGYLSEAQRRVFEQYCQKQVWGYWALENAWGNLSLDKNPAAKDNIMLTGYININLLLYMNATGDDRYTKPGSMNFIWNDKTSYQHDIHTINQSIMDNFLSQKYCLYPCEPNWIYPACNLRGMIALALYDTVFGTKQIEEIMPAFRKQLEAEFINPDGTLVSLRSKHTGHALPFPVPAGGLAKYLHPVLPDLAKMDYAFARHENIEFVNGTPELKDVDAAFDFGHYRPGYGFVIDSIFGGAAEFGDTQYVNAAKKMVDEKLGKIEEDGKIYWKASTLANSMIIESQLAFKDAYNDSVLTRPSDEVLNGPILADVAHPNVLVAKALSHDGNDLELVLYPGKGDGEQSLGLQRLQPGQQYHLNGHSAQTFTANDKGNATIDIELKGRTALHIKPIH